MHGVGWPMQEVQIRTHGGIDLSKTLLAVKGNEKKINSQGECKNILYIPWFIKKVFLF